MAATWTDLYATSQSISTTERSLTNGGGVGVQTRTDNGHFCLWLDLSPMAAGDQFELKLYEKIASGGTQRLVETWNFYGAQGEPHFVTPFFALGYGWDFTLKKIAGTDRTIVASTRQA